MHRMQGSAYGCYPLCHTGQSQLHVVKELSQLPIDTLHYLVTLGIFDQHDDMHAFSQPDVLEDLAGIDCQMDKECNLNRDTVLQLSVESPCSSRTPSIYFRYGV